MVNKQIVANGIRNPQIIKAMLKVPRHLFVPEELIDRAYDDTPLPIGYNQTISQPFIVAYMTELSKPSKNKKALEIGTGSGYQAAVLAELVDSVYTIEIIPELAKEAAERLSRLGYRNVVVRTGDGYNGWKEHSPYDIILVTAAGDHIPQPLLDQLSENGRLIMPVGSPSSAQYLYLAVKKNGKIERTRLAMVRFVPLLRSK
ncbi:MAG TPA: protein-L-isoaspartate(D-aspartate) O-methyltransferase [Bacteroidales bacterium]|nr:protein-L-isoaspartate(D-aspartate) O-methyltransferase [Bacteroidales bacterium]HOU95117.1 protein-L-isoaspartate(D-aspartate) O-methyltransferase [Bacteroidales bacterium]HQG36393.1 protein-L-isoaspartate(D-aspartate) O-methyltransferase [Bacteroidales bacterium]HQG53720.1 protein-L-isoaspartate(D-aspartate) O-methyltransferase [Bacteroidales bacterium]HQJ21097.1 protein-L-isoaspartate(D-aspartate) O-methyltransferase [Bacteroidales bacterium]